MRQIAAELDRSPATISRELRRNADPVSGVYRPFAAQRLAALRRARPRPSKLAVDLELRDFVQARLLLRWSPDQICQALRREFPDQPRRHLVHETVYQAVYREDRGGLHRELPRVLRTGRRRRRPRRRPDVRRPGKMLDMTMIDQRPAEAADRTVPGHWEGDLLMGAVNRSAIGTLVERTSRFTILLHLPSDHSAETVRDAVTAALAPLPPRLRRSLAWDQGKEMALHREITTTLRMPVYFCHKASPWQRPSNEHTNGLLRQYFPKGTDLRVHDADRLQAVAAELNGRPRRRWTGIPRRRGWPSSLNKGFVIGTASAYGKARAGSDLRRAAAAHIYDWLDGDRRNLDAYTTMADQLGARSVLDIGCGTGTLACQLATRGLAVTAVDPAAASLEMARAKPGADLGPAVGPRAQDRAGLG